MRDVSRRIQAGYRALARAVIESALDDDDRDFFLKPEYDYLFTLWTIVAELDKKTLQKYMMRSPPHNWQSKKSSGVDGNIKSIRVRIKDKDFGIYKSIKDAANILGLSVKSIGRAYKRACESRTGVGVFTSHRHGKVYIIPV